MLLGKRIREYRKSLDLTQEELGDMINVTKVSICCYESGSRTPTLETLLDLAKVFNTDVNGLLGIDTYIVSDKDENYGISAASEEVDLIVELRKHTKLYDSLINDTKRTIELIEKRLR